MIINQYMFRIMKKIVSLLFILPFFGMGIMSCSNDDEPIQNTDDEAVIHVEDELAILQESLVKVDENGNLVERILGVPLDAADPDEVSVGVDSYDEALETFGNLFADTTAVSNNGTLAEFSLQQGKAELTKASGSKGMVACAVFDVPGLKHVSKVNFILNSAWPNNAGGKEYHKLGYQYQMKGFTGKPTYIEKRNGSSWDQNELHTYVCIREYSNGVPALLVAISNGNYTLCWRYMEEYGGNMPAEWRAKGISDILRSNWENYKKWFNANGHTNRLNDATTLYIYGGKDHGFWVNTKTIRLFDGHIDDLETKNNRHDRAALFFMESGLVQ